MDTSGWYCPSSYRERQPPKMENGEECIDWFSFLNELDQCHAVAGRAENAPSFGNGYQKIEWFEIKCINGATKRRFTIVNNAKCLLKIFARCSPAKVPSFEGQILHFCWPENEANGKI
ncbi:MAG: hypothetical protein U0905_22770 [Pirellulales bacterium]